MGKDHFLSATEAQEHIEADNILIETLLRCIQTSRTVSEEQVSLNLTKSFDQGQFFAAPKVRAMVPCD
jgi:hypothetical protein